ncbi:MAG: hypothetical protein A2W93_10730 [Bacteroidetes bacterium GWF2_43_63]|nr:MAG: hypothetical protein A2W94_01730 [Bacteroidetes bacterium GWE2_42_42]OFY52988.1 MAG: hypothetical protein A2W93_10730 [Bacteroidetes bacterium GWF2_43_63]HCB62187.1 hypothetical protein [Bacteroidales bacterium]
MIKVLILAYDFPPYISVGAQRPYYWYRYFKEFGIDPVVVSRQWNNNYSGADQYVAEGYSDEDVVKKTNFGQLIKAPYKPNIANRLYLKYGDKNFRFLRKIISGYYEIMQWHYPIGPKMGVYKTAREYLSTNKVDIIVASGDPYILFKYASKLSSKFKIPWIADYRDPWITKSSGHSLALYLKKQVDYHNERRFLKNATCITTVSEYFRDLIKTNLPDKNFVIIPNGFDSEQMQSALKVQQDADFLTICLIGRIYKYYPVELVFSAFDSFIQKHPDFRFKLIGLSGENISDTLLKKYPAVFKKTISMPALPSAGVMEELAKSHALLLFNMYSIIGTKIYDYIAIKRKILLCFSDEPEANKLRENYFSSETESYSDQNAQEKLIREKDSGIIVKNKEHLLEVLNELYKEFFETGQIECHSKDISEYSRKAQTEKLADLIHKLLENNNNLRR